MFVIFYDTRIAGCHIDKEGEFDGSFNTNFLKLSAPERKKHIEIAKAIPFAETNKTLKKFEFKLDAQKPGSMWQLPIKNDWENPKRPSNT